MLTQLEYLTMNDCKSSKMWRTFLRRCRTLGIKDMQLSMDETPKQWMVVTCIHYSKVEGADITLTKPATMDLAKMGPYVECTQKI